MRWVKELDSIKVGEVSFDTPIMSSIFGVEKMKRRRVAYNHLKLERLRLVWLLDIMICMVKFGVCPKS